MERVLTMRSRDRRRQPWRAAAAVACLVCVTLPVRASERPRAGASVFAGAHLPTTSATEGSALRAKPAAALGAALAGAAPLGGRLSFVLAGGGALWRWSDARRGESVDATVLLLSLAPGARLGLGGGLYAGGGVEAGRTLPVAISRTVFSGDVGGGAATDRSFSVVGPRVELGAGVGPDGVFDLGLRAAWLRGAPGDPALLSAYAGVWF